MTNTINLHVPDALTASSSENYIVAVRLSAGGFSFAGFIPSENDSLFCGEISIDRTKPYIQAIKDIFFAHPFLAYTYRHTHVICANRQFTLVPENVYVEKQQNQLMNFIFASPDGKTLHKRLDDLDCEVIYGIQPEVYDFLSRSLLKYTFTHAIVPLLGIWLKQSVIAYPKQLFVSLYEDTMDAACFYRDNLLFINSFKYDDTADILYYILYIWKQTAMDQQQDRLVIHANADLHKSLKDTLQTYIVNIEFVQPQATDAGMQVPADITALFSCES
ncbi:MAG: DUF3822 family protein [Tannerella sp.]|jgi:hypothetical protein|nr:DUF3822 family protein [Tannerella sp.]